MVGDNETETPNDFVRSIKTFGRFLTKLKADVERQIARKPEETRPKNYINDLKRKLQTASKQQACMEKTNLN